MNFSVNRQPSFPPLAAFNTLVSTKSPSSSQPFLDATPQEQIYSTYHHLQTLNSHQNPSIQLTGRIITRGPSQVWKNLEQYRSKQVFLKAKAYLAAANNKQLFYEMLFKLLLKYLQPSDIMRLLQVSRQFRHSHFKKTIESRLEYLITHGDINCYENMYDYAMKVRQNSECIAMHFQKYSSLRSPFEEVIRNDVDRTFLTHDFFKNTSNQENLNQILKSFASKYPQHGYTQGLNYIAAVLSTFMQPKNAFWALDQIFEKYGLSILYKDHLKDLSLFTFQVSCFFKNYLTDLFNHMRIFSVQYEIFIQRWLLTFFANDLDIPLMIKIVNLFVFKGFKNLVKAVLALLSLHKVKLLLLRTQEDIYEYLQDTISENPLSHEIFLREMKRFKVTRRLMEECRYKYRRNKNNQVQLFDLIKTEHKSLEWFNIHGSNSPIEGFKQKTRQKRSYQSTYVSSENPMSEWGDNNSSKSRQSLAHINGGAGGVGVGGGEGGGVGGEEEGGGRGGRGTHKEESQVDVGIKKKWSISQDEGSKFGNKRYFTRYNYELKNNNKGVQRIETGQEEEEDEITTANKPFRKEICVRKITDQSEEKQRDLKMQALLQPSAAESEEEKTNKPLESQLNHQSFKEFRSSAYRQDYLHPHHQNQSNYSNDGNKHTVQSQQQQQQNVSNSLLQYKQQQEIYPYKQMSQQLQQSSLLRKQTTYEIQESKVCMSTNMYTQNQYGFEEENINSNIKKKTSGQEEVRMSYPKGDSAMVTSQKAIHLNGKCVEQSTLHKELPSSSIRAIRMSSESVTQREQIKTDGLPSNTPRDFIDMEVKSQQLPREMKSQSKLEIVREESDTKLYSEYLKQPSQKQQLHQLQQSQNDKLLNQGRFFKEKEKITTVEERRQRIDRDFQFTNPQINVSSNYPNRQNYYDREMTHLNSSASGNLCLNSMSYSSSQIKVNSSLNTNQIEAIKDIYKASYPNLQQIQKSQDNAPFLSQYNSLAQLKEGQNRMHPSVSLHQQQNVFQINSDLSSPFSNSIKQRTQADPIHYSSQQSYLTSKTPLSSTPPLGIIPNFQSKTPKIIQQTNQVPSSNYNSIHFRAAQDQNDSTRDIELKALMYSPGTKKIESQHQPVPKQNTESANLSTSKIIFIQSNLQPTQQSNLQPTQQSNLQPTQLSNLQPTQLSNLQPTQQSNLQPTQQSNLQQTPQSNLQPTQQSNLQQTPQSNLQPTQQSNLQQTQKSNLQPTQQSNMQPTQQSNLQQTQQSNLQPTQQSNLQTTQQSNLQPTKQSNLPAQQSNLQPTLQSNLQLTQQSNLQQTQQSHLLTNMQTKSSTNIQLNRQSYQTQPKNHQSSQWSQLQTTTQPSQIPVLTQNLSLSQLQQSQQPSLQTKVLSKRISQSSTQQQQPQPLLANSLSLIKKGSASSTQVINQEKTLAQAHIQSFNQTNCNVYPSNQQQLTHPNVTPRTINPQTSYAINSYPNQQKSQQQPQQYQQQQQNHLQQKQQEQHREQLKPISQNVFIQDKFAQNPIRNTVIACKSTDQPTQLVQTGKNIQPQPQQGQTQTSSPSKGENKLNTQADNTNMIQMPSANPGLIRPQPTNQNSNGIGQNNSSVIQKTLPTSINPAKQMGIQLLCKNYQPSFFQNIQQRPVHNYNQQQHKQMNSGTPSNYDASICNANTTTNITPNELQQQIQVNQQQLMSLVLNQQKQLQQQQQQPNQFQIQQQLNLQHQMKQQQQTYYLQNVPYTVPPLQQKDSQQKQPDIVAPPQTEQNQSIKCQQRKKITKLQSLS